MLEGIRKGIVFISRMGDVNSATEAIFLLSKMDNVERALSFVTHKPGCKALMRSRCTCGLDEALKGLEDLE